MAFRRGFRRRTFRRRRVGPETYTIVECAGCLNVWREAICSEPMIDMIEVMNMHKPRGPVDATEVSNPSDRAIVVKGLKFQTELWSDPSAWNTCAFVSAPVQSVSFMLKIWEALVVLPLAAGSSFVPAYIPKLTDAISQSGDLADRLLWKRISMLPMWGTNVLTNQLIHTLRDAGHGPQVVKARVRLDDRHALYYTRQFVHDLVVDIGNVVPPDVCHPSCDNFPAGAAIPVQNEDWFKVYYDTTKK